jgi:hypothetical protein
MNSLTKNLRLTKEQKPQVTAVVDDLLEEKKGYFTIGSNHPKKNQSQSYITTIFLQQFKEGCFFKTTSTIPL